MPMLSPDEGYETIAVASMPITAKELDGLIEAVRYKHAVAEVNDPVYDAYMWKPLLAKLTRLASS